MTLTPSTIRFDLKCGKGAIRQGQKCTKGTATAAKNEFLRKALIVGGSALTVGGIVHGVRKFNLTKKAAANIKNMNGQGPEAQMKQARSTFKEARGISTGAQIAGAGLSVAGAGLYAHGRDKKNGTAQVAGAGLLLLGANTLIGGGQVRRAFNQAEQQVEEQGAEYTRQYHRARQEAKYREQNAGGYHSNSKSTPNTSIKNPYKDLGVPESASDDELKQAWKTLMRKNHPDLGGDPEAAKRINAAYQEALRRRGRRDSVFADGVQINWDDFAPEPVSQTSVWAQGF